MSNSLPDAAYRPKISQYLWCRPESFLYTHRRSRLNPTGWLVINLFKARTRTAYVSSLNRYIDDPIHRIGPCFDEDVVLVVNSRDGGGRGNRHSAYLWERARRSRY